MRIGVVARGTHSLHLERGFDTLKRNLSLESRSNIMSWFRVCLWRIRHYDEPIISRRFLLLLLLFLTFKNSISTIKVSSNHLLKFNQIEQLPVGTILYFYYFGKTVHLRFCSSTPHKTTDNTTLQLDDEITKEKFDICENHLFRLKEKRKKDVEGDIRSKNDLKPPLLDERRRKKV